MNITIAGAGNVGTQLAVHAASQGNNVIIFSSKPDKIQKILSIEDNQGNILLQGEIARATDEPQIAFSNADVVLVTVPAYCMEGIAKQILPYMKRGVKIGLIPGMGGGECAFRKCLDKGAIIFGLQRVPSVARLVEYGRRVCAVGYREELHIASLPGRYAEECCEIFQDIVRMKCNVLPNYLNLTLTPSNPILHTTRLMVLFKDYMKGMYYDRIPLFYEEWNDETSELLLRCDEEVQCICKNLSQFDLSYVKSLKIHYESDDAKSLTEKIRSIQGFKGLKAPEKLMSKGFVPDFESRYFKADFPYGLEILVQIANLIDVDVPNMKMVLNWYHNLTDVKQSFDYEKYGITDLDSFVAYYNL